MKTYSLRKATLARLLVPLLAAIVVTAMSAVWLADRAIGLLRDDQMQQEAAFLLLLARHEATEGEALGLVHTLESAELRQVLGARSSFRIWSGDTIVAQSSPDTMLPPLPPSSGFSMQQSGNQRWRTFVIREIDSDIIIEICEPTAMRQAMMLRVVGSLALPLAFLLLAVAAIAYFQIHAAMRPMRRISHDLDSRQPDDFRPLGGYRIPEEVAPLFAAFNRLMTRLGAVLAREREFTDNAAHELRTPLAVLKTRAQIVARDLDDDQNRHHQVLQLVQATDRAAGVVDQLLLLNRASAKLTKPDCFDLSTLVETVCRETAGGAIAKGQCFAVDIAPGLVMAGQQDVLAMLVGNLVENAIRHTPAGSNINVSLHADPAGTACLRVCDTGPGIPPGQRDAAFDRFQRLGSDQPGSGLGLAIVKRIAEQHGGGVRLAANTPHGLCVEVSLPNLRASQSASAH